MRLWHQDLISKLPQKQLCGQWRECIALLGNGWGKKHSTVDYVFKHEEACLVLFTYLIYAEMIKRGYKPNPELPVKALLKRHSEEETLNIELKAQCLHTTLEYMDKSDSRFVKKYPIYSEHNEEYYKECIENLRKKGIKIE